MQMLQFLGSTANRQIDLTPRIGKKPPEPETKVDPTTTAQTKTKKPEPKTEPETREANPIEPNAQEKPLDPKSQNPEPTPVEEAKNPVVALIVPRPPRGDLKDVVGGNRSDLRGMLGDRTQTSKIDGIAARANVVEVDGTYVPPPVFGPPPSPKNPKEGFFETDLRKVVDGTKIMDGKSLTELNITRVTSDTTGTELLPPPIPGVKAVDPNEEDPILPTQPDQKSTKGTPAEWKANETVVPKTPPAPPAPPVTPNTKKTETTTSESDTSGTNTNEQWTKSGKPKGVSRDELQLNLKKQGDEVVVDTAKPYTQAEELQKKLTSVRTGVDSETETETSDADKKGSDKLIESSKETETAPIHTLTEVNKTEAAPAKPKAPDRELMMKQLTDRIDSMLENRKSGRMVIHLEPRELGTITLAIRTFGMKVDLDILASNDQVRQNLQESRPHLAHQVESKGYTLGQVDFNQTQMNANTNQSHGQQDTLNREDFQRLANLAGNQNQPAPTPSAPARMQTTGMDLVI